MSNKVFYDVNVFSADENGFEGVGKKDKVLFMIRLNDSFLSRIRGFLEFFSFAALVAAAFGLYSAAQSNTGFGFAAAGGVAILSVLGFILGAVENAKSNSINRNMSIVLPFNKIQGKAISSFNNDSPNCYYLTVEEEKLLFDVAQYYPFSVYDKIDELRYRRKNIPLYAQNRSELLQKIDEELRKLTAVRDSEVNVALLNEIIGLFDVFLANRRSNVAAPVLPALSDLPAVMRKKEELEQSANRITTEPVNNVSITGCSMCNARKEAALK